MPCVMEPLLWLVVPIVLNFGDNFGCGGGTATLFILGVRGA